MAPLPHEIVETRVSMASLPEEIQREILIGLDVRYLIQCKSVCKSWSSWISDSRFVKTHLSHHYDKDCSNPRFGHRRITMAKDVTYLMWRLYDCANDFFGLTDRHLLGSSNGLVCVSPSHTEIVVVNPSTRELKRVTMPRVPKILVLNSLCWGFGYDSINDDYKIVLGFRRGENHTCFHVFSLRSNIWKVIGEVKYVFTSKVGILCKGALHWWAYDTSPEKKNVILSLRLSDEKFLEVPKPDDVRCPSYMGQHSSMHLGIMEEHLCLVQDGRFSSFHELWVMKDYNKKQSWEMLGSNHEIKYELVHSLKQLKHYIPNKMPFCHQVGEVPNIDIDHLNTREELESGENRLCKNKLFYGTPIYVESLVSPHFHKELQQAVKSRKVKTNRHVGQGTSTRPNRIIRKPIRYRN